MYVTTSTAFEPSDTSDEARRIHTRGLLARSPQERVRMACSMFQTAKAIVKAGLGGHKHDPGAVFRRIYGRDFDQSTLAAIEQALRDYHRDHIP